jgi:hypothetical protein
MTRLITKLMCHWLALGAKRNGREKGYRPVIEPLEERALLSTDTWTGAGGNNLWSNPANWDTQTVPAAGDTLVFSNFSSVVPTNDLPPGTPFFSLVFGDGLTIQGNSIVLTGGGIGGTSSFSGAIINLSGITLTADQEFIGNATISSVVNCNGFTLSTSSYTVTVPGEGGSQTFTFTGNITGTVYAGNLSGDWPISGPINLTSNASISGVGCSGVISLNGFNLTLAATSNGGITGAGNVVIVPGGASISGNNSYTGLTTVTSTAGLNAFGAIPGPLIVQNGAQLSPESVGYGAILSTGPLTLEPGSNLIVTMNYPPTYPLVYSQVQANGPINLDGATLSPTVNSGHVLNQSFVILESTDSIIGNFSGLPDGAVLYIDNRPFQILYSNGTAGQPARVVLSNVQNWRDVITGDFNGDGRADIAGRNFAGQWLVGTSTGSLAAAGSYSFTNQLWTTWNPTAGWQDVQVGDFNGDGKADIAGRTASGDWWVALSNGSSFTNEYWGHWNPNVTWADVKVGDFDGDKIDDIVGRWAQTGQWWVAQSNGSAFSNSMWGQWSARPGVTWVDVNVGDFNGDGKADITGRWLEGGSWWTGISNGSTGFNTTLWAQWSAAPGVTWVDVKVGDFNGAVNPATGDRIMDITGRWLEDGSWWTGISNGSTAFNTTMWGQWSAAPGVTWVDVQVGDFDGDGKADITGRWLEGGSWWTGISNGTSFNTAQWDQWSANPGVTWVDVQAGDFAGSINPATGDPIMDITGRWREGGSWWTAASSGTNFSTTMWTTWPV